MIGRRTPSLNPVRRVLALLTLLSILVGAATMANALTTPAHPRCWGAASRDPVHPCHNRALDRTVSPSPDDAVLIPNGDCAPAPGVGVGDACTFGVDPAQATAEVLLMGDSHGAHWRPALQVVAQALHWHAWSLTRNSCPFSTARMTSPRPPLQENCDRWGRGVIAWLGQHPEVHTVFVSARAGRRFRSSAQDGFRAAWRELPASVTRIYVIRDVPQGTPQQQDCVDAAIATHRPPGTACALPRKRALVTDTQADAARARPGPVRLLDLTPFFCDAKSCFPVVGGVLVRRDLDHLTREYSISLGAYLLRLVRAAP